MILGLSPDRAVLRMVGDVEFSVNALITRQNRDSAADVRSNDLFIAGSGPYSWAAVQRALINVGGVTAAVGRWWTERGLFVLKTVNQGRRDTSYHVIISVRRCPCVCVSI